MALLLGMIGLYGVIAYSVSQRTREIGVRMALGAQREMVQRMVLKEGGRLAMIGIVLGLVCSLAASLLLRSVLFGVQTWDVGTLGGVDFMLRASEVLDVLDEATKLVHLTYGSEKCEREHTRDFCAVVHASKEGETKYRVIYRSVLVTKVCCGFCFLNLPPPP